MSNFVDLHVHTKYSLLDSTIEPEELVKVTKALGRKAIAVSEHGNLYSSIEMYKLCQKYGLKYIHACEMYICKQHPSIKNKENKYNHLIVISKNEIGRLNLIKLVTEGNKYKYFGKPRIDHEMLLQHKEGLIVCSACLGGEVQRALQAGDYDQAIDTVKMYHNEFGDDYYLELQSHRETIQQEINRKLVNISNELGIKYIISTDAHYLRAEDAKYHEIFVQIGQNREVSTFHYGSIKINFFSKTFLKSIYGVRYYLKHSLLDSSNTTRTQHNMRLSPYFF